MAHWEAAKVRTARRRFDLEGPPIPSRGTAALVDRRGPPHRRATLKNRLAACPGMDGCGAVPDSCGGGVETSAGVRGTGAFAKPLAGTSSANRSGVMQVRGALRIPSLELRCGLS